MNFESLMESVHQYENEVALLKKKYSDSMQVTLKEMFVSFFQEDQNCYAFSWQQYTPYFNDGDECVFTVYSPEFFSKEEYEQAVQDESFDEGDLYHGNHSNQVWDRDLKAYRSATEHEILRKQISTLLQSESISEVLKLMFGDHVQVVVTKDNIEVTEYDHD